MATGGIFVTLSDEETLNLYLDQGVYGQHMTPEEDEPSPYSAHYRTLADYGAIRDGYHVFFFLDRKIYYGGQVVGSDEHGAFHINGRKSPLGRAADAPLVWDESSRERYEATDEPGVFERDDEDDGTCQPFLIRFEDRMDMAGNYVTAHRFYFALGDYPHLLPSHGIGETDTNLRTLTPGETETLVDLLRNDPDGRTEISSAGGVELVGKPVPYSPEYSIGSDEGTGSKSRLAASIVSNPSSLPPRLRPDGIFCRNVPLSPFRPPKSTPDRASLCYFADECRIGDGTIPEMVIELEPGPPGEHVAHKIQRYLRWLHYYLGDEAAEIRVFVFAPECAPTFWIQIPDEYESQVEVVTFAER